MMSGARHIVSASWRDRIFYSMVALFIVADSLPRVRGLQRLDEVMASGQFTDYYSLNLRRLHVNWLVSRVRGEANAITYWTEHPHALKALLWLGLGLILLLAGNLPQLVHLCLRRSGWVRRSSLPPPTVLEPQAAQDDRVTAQGTATAVSSRS